MWWKLLTHRKGIVEQWSDTCGQHQHLSACWQTRTFHVCTWVLSVTRGSWEEGSESVCAPAHLRQAANRHHLRTACYYTQPAFLQSLLSRLPAGSFHRCCPGVITEFSFWVKLNAICTVGLRETLFGMNNLHSLRRDSAFAFWFSPSQAAWD